MIVLLFVERVISGKSNFVAEYGAPEYIPLSLSRKVAATLIELGLEYLVPEKYRNEETK